MSRDRRRPQKANDRRAREPRSAGRWVVLLPVLVVVVLNVPCIDLGYFWDDFYFLTFQGRGDVFAFLLPEPSAAFYRPIPLGIYFKALRFMDPAGGMLGHILNLAALGGVVALLSTLVSRLCGSRAGLFAGLFFACYGPVPGLVAWISCSQDLFALLFVVAAFLFRHDGKSVPALACAAAGLLCKETALAALPVLVLWDWIVGREAKNGKIQLAGYAAIFLLWAYFHPGIQQLTGRGFKSGVTGYVGIEQPERWGPYLWRYLMTLVNLPPSGLASTWWADRAVYGFAALGALALGLWNLDRPRRLGGAAESVPLARVAWLAALFAIPGLLMPTLMVRHWTPYFACFPALGVSILLGPALARRGRLTAIAALAVFLLLGIWSRGVTLEREWVLGEPAMVESSRAVREVRAGFLKLFPALPKGSQVVVSVATKGMRGIQSALIDGQALTLWYADPTLRTVTTRARRPGAPAEFLARVTNDLDVIAVDVETLRVRSARGNSPDLAEIDPLLNDYARAVAAGGDTDRAIRVLEGLSGMETGDLIAYNRRLSASMLLAAGRRGEADSILAATAPFPRDVALRLVLRLLADASSSERLDEAAFEAFGLSGSDPATIRWIMRELRRSGSTVQAAWFAQRLERLAPGDPESAQLLERAARRHVTPSREPPRRLSPGLNRVLEGWG